MWDVNFTDVRVSQFVRVTQERVDKGQQFDLIVSKDKFKTVGKGIAITKEWLSVCNDNLMVGPTVADIESVVKAIWDLRPARVAAFGGARVLGATVLGSYLASQSTPDGLGPWLRDATSNGQYNFCRLRSRALAGHSAQVDVVPASLLAVVVSVFVETVAYADDDPQGKRSEARRQLDSLAATIVENGRGELNDGFVQACVNAAIESRSSENALGPKMPALALSQAVARTCAEKGIQVPGSQVIAHILPHMLDRMRSCGKLLAGEGDTAGWTALCRRLQDTWPDRLRDDKYDDDIATGAAMQTLSKRAGLEAADHKAVLSAVRRAVLAGGPQSP